LTELLSKLLAATAAAAASENPLEAAMLDADADAAPAVSACSLRSQSYLL